MVNIQQHSVYMGGIKLNFNLETRQHTNKELKMFTNLKRVNRQQQNE